MQQTVYYLFFFNSFHYGNCKSKISKTLQLNYNPEDFESFNTVFMGHIIMHLNHTIFLYKPIDFKLQSLIKSHYFWNWAVSKTFFYGRRHNKICNLEAIYAIEIFLWIWFRGGYGGAKLMLALDGLQGIF